MRNGLHSKDVSFSPLRRLWVALLISVVTAALIVSQALQPIDLLIYDAGQRLADREAPADILIVEIDETSIRQLGRWPWSRARHAELVDKLAQASVKAIVLDLIFADPQPSASNVDQQFASAIERAGNVVLPLHISELQQGGQLLEILPLPLLSGAAAAIGHAHYELDADGVCRSVFLREGIGEPYWPHLSVALAKLLGDPPGEPLPGQQYDLAAGSSLSVQRNYRNLIPFFGEQKPLASVSYLDILQGRVPDQLLRDKVVFVGATAVGLGDRIVTPTSSEESLLSGVKLNATIYHALRNGTFILAIETKWQLLANVVAAFIIALFGAFMAPRQLMLFVASGIVGLNLLALAGPYYTGVWLGPTALSVALLLSYLLWSLSRLQQALHYLRGELRKLSAESSFLQRQKDIDEIYAGLHFLVRVLPINGWSVSCNGARLVSWGVSQQRLDDALQDTDVWHHEGATSGIAVEFNDDIYVIRLHWNSDSKVDPEHCAPLNSLVSNFIKPTDLALPKAPEAVTDAILRLQKANHNFREVSHLAQRSLSRMVDGIAITDRSGRMLFENLQFHGLLRGGGEARQGNILDVFEASHPVLGEHWDDILKPVYLEGKSAQCEAVTPFGLHVLCQVNLLTSGAGEQLIMFVVTDISVLKEYEQARTETLNFLSHDLRSPLVSILALIENARTDDARSGDPELLDAIEAYANTNLRFAESFLQLARAEANESISFEPTDMHAVIANAVGQAYQLAIARDIRLRQECCEEDVWLMGHSDLLERAVVNLITNAIKYSDEHTQVTVRLQVDTGVIICEVADQGIGIAADELGNIFQRFQRGSSQNSKKRAGTGLGLRFVSVVCTRHAGEITVQSEPGKGSVFTLKLPRYEMEQGTDR